MSSRQPAILFVAAFPVIAPGVLWLLGTLVYNLHCPTWCLTCTTVCAVGTFDLGWLMTFGLILSPCVLIYSVPLSAVLVAIVLLRRRQEWQSAQDDS